MFKAVNYVNNQLNFGKANNELTTEIRFSINNFKYIQFLSSIGYLQNYYLIKKQNRIYIRVALPYLNYAKKFYKMKILSTRTRKVFISTKAMRLMLKRLGTTFFILSTQKGLMSLHRAVDQNIGGVLLVSII